jgi:hypothetical protein
MAHNVSKAYQIAEKPWIVQVTDTPTRDFLAGLISSPADLIDTEETLLLWAAELDGAPDAGTAYVVSPEAYKRVQARRF